MMAFPVLHWKGVTNGFVCNSVEMSLLGSFASEWLYIKRDQFQTKEINKFD